MSKPKPDQPTESLLISLPYGLKDEWKEWSKNTLQTSISQMIRSAVKEYQRNYEKLEEPSINSEIQNEILKLKFEKNEEIETYKKLIQEMKQNTDKITDLREIKDQILSLLELEPMDTKTIAIRIRLDKYETSNILTELLESKMINFTNKKWEIIQNE